MSSLFLNQQQMIYFIVAALFFIIFCFLFRQKQSLESFTDIQSGIQSVFESRQNMTLNQYMIMASLDSAYDGSTISLKQLKSVISTGCRFFDFQVFLDESFSKFNRPYVGYSTDSDYKTIQGINSDPKKRVTLSKILSTTVASCFSTDAPNVMDPVFIHLRIKSKNTEIYGQIATDIQDTISSRLYRDTETNQITMVTKDTPLKNIMGKVIIIVDHLLAPDYTKHQYCADKSCVNLANFTHVESGGTQWRQLPFNPPENMNCLTQGGLVSPILDENTDNNSMVCAPSDIPETVITRWIENNLHIINS